MSDFWTGFLANLAADALVGLALYLAITWPSEKRAQAQSLREALGLLRVEAQINAERAQQNTRALGDPALDLTDLSAVRYSRGAWNALKESNFLPKLRDPRLVSALLLMNEATYVANRNVRRLELSFTEDTGGNRRSQAMKAMHDSEQVLHVLRRVLPMLNQMSLPVYEPSDLFETSVVDDLVDEEGK